MNQGSIFCAMVIGAALVMAIVIFSMAWNVFKETISYRKQCYQPRKVLMESQMLLPVAKVVCSCITLMMYVLFVTLMVLFNSITVGLFLGSLFVSVSVGVGMYLIINAFQHEIETSITKSKFKIVL